MNLEVIRERIGVRPWRAGVLLVGFVLIAFVVVPIARPLLGFTCDAEEKAALMEFSQYGERAIGKDIKGPLGGEVLNFPPLQEPPPGCALGFADRQATSKQVAAYYEKQLTEHGWKVERFPVSLDPQSEEPKDFIYPHVDGSRDDLRYEVHYWPTSLSGGSKMSDFSAAASRVGAQGCKSSCTDDKRSVSLPVRSAGQSACDVYWRIGIRRTSGNNPSTHSGA